MKSERGAALVLALMILSFLFLLGGALLTSSTMDIWIGDNFQSNIQLVYAAEAGLERARHHIHAAFEAIPDLLNASAGPDGVFRDSQNPDELISSDDRPLFPSDSARASGEILSDSSGRELGRYWVWLRNDLADGTKPLDTNQVLNLLAFAKIGRGRKVIEMSVIKGRFPRLPAALTLGGEVAFFGATTNDFFTISGEDAAGVLQGSIGVLDSASSETVVNAIPQERAPNYRGVSGLTPDIQIVEKQMEPSLKIPARLEDLVVRIADSATDVYGPAFGSAFSIGNYGTSTDYRIAVVNGDCRLGPGTGYGMLVVRGDLTLTSGFRWFGLLLVIGQGRVRWTGNGDIEGAVFVAHTRSSQSSTEPLGVILPSLGSVEVDLSAADAGSIRYNSMQVTAANRRIPYQPISVREY